MSNRCHNLVCSNPKSRSSPQTSLPSFLLLLMETPIFPGAQVRSQGVTSDLSYSLTPQSAMPVPILWWLSFQNVFKLHLCSEPPVIIVSPLNDPGDRTGLLLPALLQSVSSRQVFWIDQVLSLLCSCGRWLPYRLRERKTVVLTWCIRPITFLFYTSVDFFF